MSRLRNATGIDAKVYRHFAVLTLGITLMLAFFADGEGRQSVVRTVDRSGDLLADTGAEIGKKGRETFTAPIRDPNAFAAARSYDDGGGSDYGTPMDNSGGSVDSSVMPADLQTARYVPGSYSKYGMTKEQWEALSEEERKRVIELFGQRPDPALRAAQIERLKAQSAARSGSAG